MENSTADIFRVDPLTGCRNFLGFIEQLECLLSDSPERSFSILYADMNHLAELNESRGYAYGDTALRWLEIVLREESGALTYRLGGDDFSVILNNGSRAGNETILQKVVERMNREALNIGLPKFSTSVALVHYDNLRGLSVEDLFIHLVVSMMQIKIKLDRTIHIFHSNELTLESIQHEPQIASEILQQVTHLAVKRTLFMGHLLDTVQKSAYIDSTSGLPNMRAAMQQLEQVHREAGLTGKHFALLLMDGDNLRLYNEISYRAGDEMIRTLGSLLAENLRPGDFVARWRAGDEFAAILPATPEAGALVVAERFRAAVKQASTSWSYPTTISIGVACYPRHGADIEALVDSAEGAMKRAKDGGKDGVRLAD